MNEVFTEKYTQTNIKRKTKENKNRKKKNKKKLKKVKQLKKQFNTLISPYVWLFVFPVLCVVS